MSNELWVVYDLWADPNRTLGLAFPTKENAWEFVRAQHEINPGKYSDPERKTYPNLRKKL